MRAIREEFAIKITLLIWRPPGGELVRGLFLFLRRRFGEALVEIVVKCAHGGSFMGSSYVLCEYLRDREDLYLLEPLLGGDRDGVRDQKLFDWRVVDSRNGIS